MAETHKKKTSRMGTQGLLFGLMWLLAVVASGQDRVTIGNGETCVAVTPGTTHVTIPIHVRDMPGTPLGRDRVASQKLQGFAVQVRPSPAEVLVGQDAKVMLAFRRAGPLNALTPAYETQRTSASASTYLGVFREERAAVSLGSELLGDHVLDATITLPSSVAEGTRIELLLDPKVTALSNEAGTLAETEANGYLQLRNGCLQIRRGVPDVLTALPAPQPARQAADPEVVRVIARDGAADVVIHLRETLPVTALDAERMPPIRAVQQRLLDGLPPTAFQLRHRMSLSATISGRITAAGLKTTLLNPDVVAIEVDRLSTVALCESRTAIGASAVNDGSLGQSYSGSGIRVATLDTGVSSGHWLLHDRIIGVACTRPAADCPDRGPCSPNSNLGDPFPPCTATPNIGRDVRGHGTATAGVIVAQGTCPTEPRGIAPGAGAIVIRATNDLGGILDSDLQFSLEWVYLNRSTLGVRALNMSFTSQATYSGACDSATSNIQSIADQVNLLRNSGVALFASSGNYGIQLEVGYPACISGVIGVGATFDKTLTVAQPPGDNWFRYTSQFIASDCRDMTPPFDINSITCFSNSSASLDMVAPGVYITTPTTRIFTDPSNADAGDGLRELWGTSFSAPHATASAALLFQVRLGTYPCTPAPPATSCTGPGPAKRLGPTEAEHFLKTRGVPVQDPKNGLWFPRIDVAAAVTDLRNQRDTLRGDADGSGTVDTADANYVADYLFSAGPAPTYIGGNANCVDPITSSDIFRIINYVNGGAAPDDVFACGGPGPV